MDNTKVQLKKYYDKYANDRNMSQKHQWKIDLRDTFLKEMKKEGCRELLEVGVGTGQDSLVFMENGLNVKAIDLSQEHVRICKTKGIEAHVMDMMDMSFEDSCFDCIYTLNCLLHIPKNSLSKAFNEFSRVLKSGGYMFICQYGNKEEDDEGIKNFDGKGERFFAFRTVESFLEIVNETGIKVIKSGVLDVGFDTSEVQYFILKKS